MVGDNIWIDGPRRVGHQIGGGEHDEGSVESIC